ncbi:hypothetical protein Q0812_02655 [Brevundimonas sp. 2R-24]|uniref:Uncharacterized protein n=1 Tax=Peiella sedimenti TaxID=3061083 RepID=A0ABT8SIC5_9CAUL|nr:hypothetical protein [Caulobacteraceae bacterium XZ-24]
MADEFERDLQRLFQQAEPGGWDADAFARRIEARLQRAERLRLAVLLLAGLVGAGLAAQQMMNSTLGAQLMGLFQSAVNLGGQAETAALGQIDALSFGGSSVVVMWLLAAALAGAAILGARLLNES